jgi:hypothetical protein
MNSVWDNGGQVGFLTLFNGLSDESKANAETALMFFLPWLAF